MKTRLSSLALIVLLVAGAAYAQEAAPNAAPAEAPPQSAVGPQPVTPPVAPALPAAPQPTEPPQPSEPMAPGQIQPPPISGAPGMPRKESDLALEDWVERALASSPEIDIAEAQLREAEARLKQVRAQVAQQAVVAFHERMKAEQAVEMIRTTLDEAKRKVEDGLEPSTTVMQLQQRLAEAQAEIAKQNAAFRSLDGVPMLGMSGATASPMNAGIRRAGGLMGGPRTQQPRPKLEDLPKDEMLSVLSAPTSIEFQDRDLSEVVDYIHQYFGLNIVMDAALPKSTYTVTIAMDEVPLEQALLALADRFGDVVFLVRDYGIFATTRENAETIAAPSIPPNIPLYVPVDDLMGQSGGFGGGSVVGVGGMAGGFGGGVGGEASAPPKEASIRLLDIQRTPDGAYTARILTKVAKWYREGESFEVYTLTSINAEQQLVTVWSEETGKSLTLHKE